MTKKTNPKPTKNSAKENPVEEIVEPVRTPKTLTFDCISVTQAKYTLAVFAISAKELWKIVAINKREPDKDKGYQRVLSEGRVGAISRYVQNGNCLPTSVLVTFDEGKLNNEKNKITIPNLAQAGWVIDGQHRLAGIHASEIDMEVSVVAFLGLAEKEQITQFVKINREAKNVPASLYIDLLKHLPDKTDAELAKERCADIAAQLHKDEDSPFYGKIARLGTPKLGQISLVNFARRVTTLIARPKGKLALYSLTFQIGLLKNYYKALAHVFPDVYNPKEGVSVLFQTLGFGATILALPTIFDICLKEHQGFRVEDLVNTFKRIDDFDFEKWAEMGTGSEAEKLAGDDLVEKLLERTGDGNVTGGFDLPL
jgi:DGQHR domain-containing protein